MKKLQFDLDKLDKSIYRAIENTYTAELIRRTPKKTGFVAGSWETIRLGRFHYAIINPQGEIVTFLDEGTKPHVIVPKTKKMLKFPIDKAPTMRNAKDQKLLAKNNQIWFYGKDRKPILGYVKEGSKWFVFAKKVHHPGFERQMNIEEIFNSSTLFEKFKNKILKDLELI